MINLEEKKFELDLISKEIDLIHKKILILIGGVAGSWFYAIDFAESENTYLNILSLFFIFTFLVFVIGTGVNYLKLNKLQKEINKLKTKEKENEF
jgi:hypothetical protein